MNPARRAVATCALIAGICLPGHLSRVAAAPDDLLPGDPRNFHSVSTMSGSDPGSPSGKTPASGGRTAADLQLAGAPAPLVPKQIYRTHPGPWGELEYYVAYLQAPQNLIDALTVPSATPAWHFPGQSLEDSIDGLQSIGFTRDDLAWLSEPFRSHSDDSGTRLLPPVPFIESLSPRRRALLAGILSQFEENQYFRNPVVIESGDPLTWYLEAGLSEAIVQNISQLCYPGGDGILFSDVACVLSRITSAAEERKFLRSLTRTRTLILRLVLSKESNIGELTEYWSAGYKKMDISSILEAVVDTPGAANLDITYLLPPTPRTLLYTYPDMGATLTGRLPDCHWTSTNFFRAQPKDSFADTGAALREMSRNPVPAGAPLQFGDLHLFRREGTIEAFHSAIHIADDIVFTKNGHSPLNPWVLMRFSDMASRYGIGSAYEVTTYRRK